MNTKPLAQIWAGFLRKQQPGLVLINEFHAAFWPLSSHDQQQDHLTAPVLRMNKRLIICGTTGWERADAGVWAEVTWHCPAEQFLFFFSLYILRRWCQGWSPALKHWGAPVMSFALITKSPSKHTHTMNNGWRLGVSYSNTSVHSV